MVLNTFNQAQIYLLCSTEVVVEFKRAHQVVWKTDVSWQSINHPKEQRYALPRSNDLVDMYDLATTDVLGSALGHHGKDPK